MTTNAIEIQHGTIAPSATGSVTITTALLSTDRVAVIVVKNTTSGTPVVTGLGATWTSSAQSTSSTDMYLFSASGFASGGGVITITISQASATEYAVYVLRSDAGIAPDPTIAQVGGGTVSPAGSLVGPIASQTALAGTFVIIAGWVQLGTADFPQATTTPAPAGWTIDHTVTNVKIASHLSTVDESIMPIITSTSATIIVVGRIAFYDGVVPGIPPENRLHGIYSEVLESEGSTMMRVHGAYMETLEVEGPVNMRLHAGYLEVLTTAEGTEPLPESDMGGTWGG